MAASQAKQRETLVRQRKYAQALKLYDQALQSRPNDSGLLRERGHLNLYLAHAQQARSDFDAVHRIAAAISRTRPGRLHSNDEFDAVGLTYWIEDRRDLALAFWRYTTSSLLAGRVSYAHMGGGIESGLLLWFGAVHERRPADIDLVRQLYQNRLASTFWSHNLDAWPGPLVRFFLDEIDEESLLKSALDGQAICQARFALAIRARSVGRHALYKKQLQLAIHQSGVGDIFDYYNVWPFFLASAELKGK